MIIGFIIGGVIAAIITMLIFYCLVVGKRAENEWNFSYSNTCEYCKKDFTWIEDESIYCFLNLDGTETHIVECPHCKRKTRVRR